MNLVFLFAFLGELCLFPFNPGMVVPPSLGSMVVPPSLRSMVIPVPAADIQSYHALPMGTYTGKAKRDQPVTCLATPEHVALHITDEAAGIPLQRYAKNATPNCRMPQGLGVPTGGDVAQQLIICLQDVVLCCCALWGLGYHI